MSEPRTHSAMDFWALSLTKTTAPAIKKAMPARKKITAARTCVATSQRDAETGTPRGQSACQPRSHRAGTRRKRDSERNPRWDSMTPRRPRLGGLQPVATAFRGEPLRPLAFFQFLRSSGRLNHLLHLTSVSLQTLGKKGASTTDDRTPCSKTGYLDSRERSPADCRPPSPAGKVFALLGLHPARGRRIFCLARSAFVARRLGGPTG
jgi:hypothetical protein